MAVRHSAVKRVASFSDKREVETEKLIVFVKRGLITVIGDDGRYEREEQE